MTTQNASPTSSPAWRRWFFRAALVAFAGSVVYFSWHWAGFRDGPAMRDFVSPYTGARCLWAGCNSYDVGQIAGEFARAGGTAADHPRWSWASPVYPPSALIALLPFSLLPYHAARAVWYLLSVALLVAAMLAIVNLTAPRRRPWALLLGILLLGSEPASLLLSVGQPSAAVIGLSLLALWCLLRARYATLAWICLGLALALKPQLAGLMFLYLILRPVYRRPAIQAGLLAIAMLAVGCAWLSLSPVSRTWRQDMQTALHDSLVPGAINDPSPANPGSIQLTNAQAVLCLLIKSPRSYNFIAYALGAALLAAWIVLVLRAGGSRRAMLAALAAIACMGLLPIYHREYDVALLMLSFPLLIDLVFERKAAGFAALLSTAVLLAQPRLHHLWIHAVLGMKVLPSVTSPQMRTLFLRQQPILLFVLSLLYLCILAEVLRRPDHAGNVANI
jgi:hypothetical protein